MKTVTEFSSMTLKLANDKLQEIVSARPKGQAPAEVAPADTGATELAGSAVPAEPQVEAAVADAGESTSGETSLGTPSDSPTEPSSNSNDAIAAAQATGPAKGVIKIKPPKPALKETLSEDEKKALGAALKLDDLKVGLLVDALDLMRGPRQGLRRIRVFSVAENEPVPSGSKKIGEHHFLAEMIPGLPQKEAGRGGRGDRGGRPEGGKGRGGRGGRGGKPGDRNGKGRGDGRREQRGFGGGSGEGRGPGAGGERGDRAPRPPRPLGAPVSKGPVPLPKPRV